MIKLIDSNESPLSRKYSLNLEIIQSIASEFEKTIDDRLRQDYRSFKSMNISGKLEARIMKIGMDAKLEIRFSSKMRMV